MTEADTTKADDHKPRSASRRWIPFVGVVALGLGVTVAVMTRPDATGQSAESSAQDKAFVALQSQMSNTLVLPDDFREVPAFALIDGNGEPITEAVFKDRWSLVFFGFTNCPDVCPISLSVMNSVVKQLESENTIEPMQVLFVTVDPNRDTPEIMGTYVSYFNPNFIGISGGQNDIQSLTSELGIVVSFTANEDRPENYSVDHTASMLMVDPEGRVRAKFSAPHDVNTIVADYTILRQALDDRPPI